LIEPLDGPSLFAEHLAQCGEGLHHLWYDVDDLEAAVAAMAERGYAVLQSGRGVGAFGDGDGGKVVDPILPHPGQDITETGSE
jgi:hypothetical protein